MSTKQSKQERGSGSAEAAGGKHSKINSLVSYFKDARTELGKVSWPTKKEVRVTSIAVLVLVVVMSIFLGLVDLLFAGIIEAILSLGA